MRKTSLGGLPQGIKILRGAVLLAGPQPCLDYETETFSLLRFERFLVPAWLTGL